jgi:hypothetical protein
MMLFEKEANGDSVQVDVKVVKLQRETVFQYPAIDAARAIESYGCILGRISTRAALSRGDACPSPVSGAQSAV